MVVLQTFEMCPMIVMYDRQLRSPNRKVSKFVQAGSLSFSVSVSLKPSCTYQPRYGWLKSPYTALWLKEAEVWCGFCVCEIWVLLFCFVLFCFFPFGWLVSLFLTFEIFLVLTGSKLITQTACAVVPVTWHTQQHTHARTGAAARHKLYLKCKL